MNRTILLLDIEQFSRRDDVVQTVLRRTLNSVVDETLATAGVERTQQYREDRGDGLIVLISGDVAKAAVLRALLTVTPELLHGHNRLAAQSAQMRLRVVLSSGEVAHDPQAGTAGGLVGHDLNQACRLLDSDALRSVLSERPGEPCALCVSQSVHEGVVQHGHRGIRPKLFQRRDVQVKDGVLPAWFYGPGQAAEGGSPARSGSVQGGAAGEGTSPPDLAAAGVALPRGAEPPAAGAVFHFHGAPTVHGSIVSGDQHGVSGGQVSGGVVLGGTSVTQADTRCAPDGEGQAGDSGDADSRGGGK
ncbi:hypothetical protein ACFPA8_02070 [Streptomyces ovatisporus]|uniref:Uncharacterized protein n=1 Tax=Streptomyces ovatisporus TaxID=1128682 RepID=A0ABV9A1P8_9ACTN